MKILIDTREQEALDIKPGMHITEVKRVKLDVGDYGCELEGKQLPLYFERKSQQDLWQTLTSDVKRFKTEVARAKEANVTLYLVIEGTLSDVYKGNEFSEIFGSQVVKTLHMFKVKYGIECSFWTRDDMKYHIIETFSACERNMAKGEPNA